MRKTAYAGGAITVILLLLLMISCKKSQDEVIDPGKPYTETFCINPGDNQVYWADSAGRQLILMGQKNAGGFPDRLTQALADAADLDPAHRILMDFNQDGNLIRMSCPEMGIMTFDHISPSLILIRLHLSDTLGTYQMAYNPDSVLSAAFTRLPAVHLKKDLRVEAGTGGKPGLTAYITAVFDPGGNYVPGMIFSAGYVGGGGRKGAIQVIPAGPDGRFTYSLPLRFSELDTMDGEFANQVSVHFNSLTSASVNIVSGSSFISQTLSGWSAMRAGQVSRTMLEAYAWLGRVQKAVKPQRRYYDIRKEAVLDIEVKGYHPSLGVQTKTASFDSSHAFLPGLGFIFGGVPAFEAFYTIPIVPVALSGYIVRTSLNLAGTGKIPVNISMRGSDGYTKSQDYLVDPGGFCELTLPGGYPGTRDEITARIMTGSGPLPGQLVKLFVIFR